MKGNKSKKTGKNAKKAVVKKMMMKGKKKC